MKKRTDDPLRLVLWAIAIFAVCKLFWCGLHWIFKGAP